MTMMMEDVHGQDLRSLARTLERDQILEVLSGGFCGSCQLLLENRIHTLLNKKVGEEVSISSDDDNSSAQLKSMDAQTPSPCQCVDEPIVPSSENTTESFDKIPEQQECTPIQTPYHTTPVHSSIQIGCTSNSSSPMLFAGAKSGDYSEDPNEHNRVLQFRRKNFVHNEYIHGRRINVLQGLELHTRVFDAEEQKQIIECVYNLQRMGKSGQLRERTYSEPRKWMRGKGRVTIQFGCCYNYARDKNGNAPGIVRDEDVDPLPPLFKQMIKRMVRWHILPSSCIPDSCIVNIYDEGDCIPPHIDHHDFVRPFCTVSLLAECNILFGSNLMVVGPGEFSGPYSISLPVGSVLLLNGNAANVAKHCIPGVPAKRISITFRKMDSSKLPHNFFHDPELQGIKPYAVSPLAKSKTQQDQREKHYSYLPRRNLGEFKNAKKRNRNSFRLERDEFSPLGRFSSGKRRIFNRRSVLLLNGNAANVAKHCIPGVPAKRISITFRKMDSSKLPHNFFHDPELQGIKPYAVSPLAKSKTQQDQREKHYSYLPRRNLGEFKNAKKRNRNSFRLERDEFSPLGRFSSGKRRIFNRR